MTFQQFLIEQTARAKSLGKEEAAVKFLIIELSEMTKTDFLMALNQSMPSVLQERVLTALNEYLVNDVPVQYLLGYCYFYGFKISVNPAVLIPRPETEELVELVLHRYRTLFSNRRVSLVDLGTGSGAMAIALAKTAPLLEVFGTDISSLALQVASHNAQINGANITFMQGDWLKPVVAAGLKVSILVSNPPYLAADDEVDGLVRNNEPALALFGGEKGLDYYEQIFRDAAAVLTRPGFLAFEHGFRQRTKLLDLAQRYFPQACVESFRDLSGRDRFLLIELKKDG